MEADKKNKILIVDDENVNLKILSHILGQEYIIYTASNGKDAIEKAANYLPDLILLDVIMPEKDGYETLTIIKQTEEIQKIPVIFITGLTSDIDEEKGLTLGAADYIMKPFSAMIVKLRVKHQIRIINQLHTIELLSMTDHLTSVLNRHSFDKKLRMEYKQAIKEKLPISLLMIDVDKFKNVNDTYGHQNGDMVLQKAADTFSKSFVHLHGFAARWSGEEFVVFLPNTSKEGAMEIAEKIRVGIENTAIPINNQILKITVSIGVNTLIPENEHSIDSFIDDADKAMYKAKDAGRNIVMAVI